jgi:methyl-accepting chemotaxis protein
MTTIRELLVKLGVDADKAKLEQFDKALEGVKGTAIGAIKVVAGLAAGLATLGAAATASAEELAKQARDIEQQSRGLGLTTDRYQELSETFKRFDLDTNDVSDALNTLADRSKDAVDGTKSMVDDFKLLGITVDQLKGKTPEQLFDVFAEAVSKSTDVTTRNAGVVRTLGDDLGRKLLPALLDGKAGLDGYAKAARDAGLIMSGGALKSAAAYEAESNQLKTTLRGLKQEITLALMPALGRLAKRAREWIEANRPMLQGTIRRAVRSLSDALAVAEALVKKLGGGSTAQGLERLAKLFASGLGIFATLKAGSALYSVFLLIKSALAIISGVGAVAVAKIAAIIAIIAVLGLAIEDVITYFRGGDSLLGRLLARAEKGGGIFAKLVAFIRAWGRAASLTFQVVGKIAQAVFSRLLKVVEPILSFIFSLIGAYWEKYASPVLSLILEVFTALYTKIGDGLEDLLKNWDEHFGFMGILADELTAGLIDAFKMVFGFISSGFNAVLDKVQAVINKIRRLPGMRDLLDEPTATSGAGDGTLLALTRRATGNAFADVRQRAGAAAGSIANSFGPTTYQITQQPGEDSAGLARRIDETRRADDAKKARLMRSRAKGER